MKTKKQIYTEFIINEFSFFGGGIENYLELPRKVKKKLKRHVERCWYYDKKRGRICKINPDLLKTPTPAFFQEMFKDSIPVNSGSPMSFRRYVENTD